MNQPESERPDVEGRDDAGGSAQEERGRAAEQRGQGRVVEDFFRAPVLVTRLQREKKTGEVIDGRMSLRCCSLADWLEGGGCLFVGIAA